MTLNWWKNETARSWKIISIESAFIVKENQSWFSKPGFELIEFSHFVFLSHAEQTICFFKWNKNMKVVLSLKTQTNRKSFAELSISYFSISIEIFSVVFFFALIVYPTSSLLDFEVDSSAEEVRLVDRERNCLVNCLNLLTIAGCRRNRSNRSFFSSEMFLLCDEWKLIMKSELQTITPPIDDKPFIFI